MKIAIVCNDTRGGVQPYVSLGAALSAAGHYVRVVAPEHFAAMVHQHQLAFAPLTQDPEEAIEVASRVAEMGTLSAIQLMLSELPKRVRLWSKETLEGCEGADLVMGGIGGMVTGLATSEKLGVRFVRAHLQPVGLRSSEYPGVLLGNAPTWLGPGGRQLTHVISNALLSLQFAGAGRLARKAIGLQGLARPTVSKLTLFGFSPLVVPLPADPHLKATGYWTSNELFWKPGPDLAAFVARRSNPVVSIGFGSMTSSDPQALTDLVVGAARDAGIRAVLLSGWAGLKNDNASDDLYVTASIPHQWLFPSMAAVVHHGGAGTTGAAFAAGVPQIVVPFAVDQPFWASRVRALGIGPPPIPHQRLTRARLAGALEMAVHDRGMRTNAQQVGTLISAERGTENAARLLEHLSER